MSLNETPSGERTHIGFFGRRNAGKSSLVNAVTGQELAVVSDTLGTTTDPVRKAMELLPLGPVVIIDTPGFDDEGELGEKRVQKTKEILEQTDIAVLVADAAQGLQDCDRDLLEMFAQREIPHITVFNKLDIISSHPAPGAGELYVSAKTGEGISALKEAIARLAPAEDARKLVGDLLSPGEIAVLVTPIDASAPKGRMILPQQQVIRDVLDAGAINVVCREFQLSDALAGLSRKPAMVITDSQVFGSVAKLVPQDIPLTSFSILMARYKGFLDTAVRGAAALKNLRDGDTVLISEGCTHHRQCGDIGTVKLPGWLREFTGKDLRIATSSGNEFPEDLSSYALVLHCGGCMLSPRTVQYRMRLAAGQNIPFTNYGVAIAHIHGILRRSLSLFPALQKLV